MSSFAPRSFVGPRPSPAVPDTSAASTFEARADGPSPRGAATRFGPRPLQLQGKASVSRLSSGSGTWGQAAQRAPRQPAQTTPQRNEPFVEPRYDRWLPSPSDSEAASYFPPAARTPPSFAGANNAPSPAGRVGTHVAPKYDWPMTPMPHGADSDAPQLLAAHRGTPAYLGFNVERYSWVPLGLLSVMIGCKLPLLYGARYASAGLVSASKTSQAVGFSVAAATLVAYWAAMAVGVADTLHLKPAVGRDVDPRMRYLGSRTVVLGLTAAASLAPLLLIGANFMYGLAYARHDQKRMSLAIIPANIGASAHLVSCGALYTVSQVRRGWTPQKLNTLTVFCLTVWAATTGAQFGVTNGEKGLPREARTLTAYLPYLVSLFGVTELFARLNWVYLRHRNNVDEPRPYWVQG